ncbi:hypothetical protein [Novosphingobium album (ex Liu et al. 2023)]|nr:hypothetical protein [Novosphingobium album (ex Liu et al. 2023)]
MADLLNAMLDDVEAQTIALTRDEAVLIQGLIEGLANCLDLPPPG